MSDFARWPLLSEAFSRLGRPVVVVDLETTGGNFYQDRITEVALVRFEQGRATHYEQLVNPCRSIPEFVAKLTRIHDETVKNAPVFADIAADLLPICCRYCKVLWLLPTTAALTTPSCATSLPVSILTLPHPRSVRFNCLAACILSFTNTASTALSNAPAFRRPTATAP